MVKVFLTSIFFIGISRTGLGSPVLTCNDVDLTSISTIQCSCYNPGGNGIDWYNAGTYLTQCTLSNKQCFPFDGYTFVVNSSTFTYTMEFGSYSYTNCSSVSCNDITTTSDSELKTISVDESSLNQTIPVINEPPANHTNGNISFTTNCLYKARSTDINVTAKWTALIVTGGEIDLEVDETISKTGSCQCCSYDFASKFSIEFYHEEEQSDQKEKAHIRIELLLDGKPASPPLRRTTNNIYYVRVRSDSTPNPKCDTICIIIIIIIIAGILFLNYCCIGIMWCCYRKQMNERNDSKCQLFIPMYGLIVFCRRIREKGLLRIKTPIASAEGYIVKWTVTDFPNENNELEYLLEYYMENKEDTTKQCIILIETQFVLENLRPKTPYKIRVYAIYQSKVIESPDEISFGTEKLQQIGHRSEADLSLSKHDPVSENPNINVTKKKSAINEPSSTCYDIEWTVENFDESRSKELRYMLECILEDDENISKERIIHSEKSFKFERLLPDKTYYIRVYAIDQTKVLEPPGKYQFRTQPMKSQPLAPIDRSKRNVQ